MPRLKKQEVNGRIENPTTHRPPGSLDEIWNTAKKPTVDLLSYEQQLKKMDLVELQTHARDEYGLFPKQEKMRMVTACLEQFQKKRGNQAGRFVKRGVPGMTKEAQQNILDIMKSAKG